MSLDEHQLSSTERADSLADIRGLLLADDTRVLRLVFRDSDTFRLRMFYQLDPSIYGIHDQWSAIVVEPICGRHPDFMRLFHADSGLDFIATDITSIADDSGAVLYRAPLSSLASRNSNEPGNA